MEEGADLGEDDEPLSGKCRFEEDFLAQGVVKHEGSRHSPIGDNLPQPVALLGASSVFDFQIIAGVARPEVRKPPMAGLAHFDFPTQMVKLENESSILRSRFLRHRNLRKNLQA